MKVTPERVTFAAAAAVLLGLAGAIAFLWVEARDPVSLIVEQVGEVRVVERQSYLTAEVQNTGDDTAQAVQVIAELIVDGEVVAEGEQAIDYLSGSEIEQIVFIFDLTAPEADTELRVASYKVP